MKSKTEIQTFFIHSINRELEELEYQRQAIIKRYSVLRLVFVLAGIVIAFGSIMLFLLSNSPEKKFEDYLNLLFIPVFLGAMSFLVFRTKRQNSFKPLEIDYKTKVLGKIAKFVVPDLKNKPDEFISKEVFEKAGLYRQENTHEGSGLLEGNINGIGIQLSLIKSYNISSRKDDKGKITTHRSMPSFEGVYCILKLSSTLTAPIHIKTKQDLNSLFSEKPIQEPITTNIAEFDSLLSLQCNSAEIVKTFISSKLFPLLLNFKKKQEGPVEYYLNGNELHIAMSGIRLEYLSVNTSFNELAHTTVFANYLNDLLGMAEDLEKSKELSN